jgi:segregation and condensation protein A
MTESDDFDDPADDATTLVLSIDGYEGPLDLLLELARNQKVDLARISILALVDQYLLFIAEARKLKLELAADYLVMAAWLAYLKSRLLLPPSETGDEPSAEDLAARLQAQLRKLEAMRAVGARLMGRDRLGRDVFARGAPETVIVLKRRVFDVTLYELLKAYAAIEMQARGGTYAPQRRLVLTLEEALHRLERLIGIDIDWMEISRFLPETADPAFRRSALASTFAASLEMARIGRVDLQQVEAYGPLFLRPRSAGA